MNERRGTSLAVVLGLALSTPALAFADLDFDNTDNVVCLTSSGATAYYCEDGGAAQALTSWTINLLGGKDTLVVNGPTCDCSCGAVNGDFVYGGNTLTVNGGDDEDILYGANGKNAFSGDAGADKVQTGSHNADTLAGGTGPDWLIDNSGTSEIITGGDADDMIRDIGCTFTSINCGAGNFDKCRCGAGPTTYCGSATCEFSAGEITIACPP